MALARYERPIQDAAGNLITASGFHFEVRREDVAGTPKKPIYSDRAGVVPLSNPADLADGVVAFHAAGGPMSVRVYGPEYDETFHYVAIGTGAEVDADQLLIPGYLFEFEAGTTAPPSDGCIRANNADLSLATRLFIWKSTIAGADISARIVALLNKRVLLTSTNAGEQSSFQVDLVTDQTTYYELVVSLPVGVTSIPAGRVGLQREGSDGAAGASGLFDGTEVILTGASETLITAYRGKTVICNRATAMALAAQAAATLGSAWAIILKNIGAGTVTLDPNGAETVDGAATIDIPQNCSLLLSSNGTLLRTELKSFSPVPVTEGGTGKTTAPAALQALSAQSVDGHSNLAIAASVGSSALTVAVKGVDGNDPSATNPVFFAFRSPTVATGAPVVRAVTAALSLVISSGSTMGFANATPGRLWLVAFDDAGTVRLGLVNCLSGTSIFPLIAGLASSTTEGGAGAADSAHVIYSGTAVSAKSMVILGYLEWNAGLTTAGTWAIVPTKIQVFVPGVPRPGEAIQTLYTSSGAVMTGTTVVPNDDTIPQSSEGFQTFALPSMTPTAACNIIEHQSAYSSVAASAADGFLVCSLFQDSVAAAIASSLTGWAGTAGAQGGAAFYHRMLAGSTAATVFKNRVGQSSAATITINGQGSARKFGGALVSYMKATELMA